MEEDIMMRRSDEETTLLQKIRDFHVRSKKIEVVESAHAHHSIALRIMQANHDL